MNHQIIRTREELAALDPDTLVQPPRNEQGEWPRVISAESLQWAMRRLNCTFLPAVVIATGDQIRAARQALEAADDPWDLPSHRTEAGYPNCSTCDGGGCPDCTDPA